MRERFVRSRGQLRLRRACGFRGSASATCSVEAQIQAAADRYAAEIRAAGERYDAAMRRILASCQHTSGSPSDDEPSAAEFTQPSRDGL
jgi:hypothetical protein